MVVKHCFHVFTEFGMGLVGSRQLKAPNMMKR